MQRIVHTKGFIDTDPYGKPAWIYEHEGGVKGIARDMQKMLQNDMSRYLDIGLFSHHRDKSQQDKVQSKPPQRTQSAQQGVSSQKKETKNNPLQTVKLQPGGVTQLSLFGQFEAAPNNRKEKPQKENFKPRPFEGNCTIFSAMAAWSQLMVHKWGIYGT
jgi:hypothetical protein